MKLQVTPDDFRLGDLIEFERRRATTGWEGQLHSSSQSSTYGDFLRYGVN
jgi:hypothetical protein